LEFQTLQKVAEAEELLLCFLFGKILRRFEIMRFVFVFCEISIKFACFSILI